MSSTKLAIFDVDGTLYRKGMIRNAYNGNVFDEAKERSVKFISDKCGMDLSRSKLLRKELYDRHKGHVSLGLQKEFGIDRNEYYAFVWGGINAYDYAIPDSRLKEMIHSITAVKVIFSSAPMAWISNILSVLNVKDEFDCIFDNTMASKYSVSGYEKLLARLCADRCETVHIDDDLAALKISVSLGIRGVYIDWEDGRELSGNLNIVKASNILDVARFL